MTFPKPKLDRDTALQLWFSERSEYAKEQVILNNTGLIGLVLKQLNLEYDEDLFDIGLLGLVKTINTFDGDKGVAFSTYATMVIRHTVLMSFRKKRIIPTVSFDEPVPLENGNEVALSEIVADKKRFEEDVIAKERFKAFMDRLSERERQIVAMAADDMMQCEIAAALGISQAHISRILTKLKKKWRLSND